MRHLVGLPPAKRPTPAKPNRPPTPCSDLYDLVLDLDWPAVIHHCRHHPHDALFQDGDTGETPLYLACQWSPPLDVLQALLDANPSACLWTSREHGDVPLHMLCRYATTTVDMVRACVTPYPASACLPTKYGKTALHVLWTHARPACVRREMPSTMKTKY